MSEGIYRGRLAPSPTGALHLGNMRSFVHTWLHCRKNHGELIMRIEDLGLQKIKAGALEQIYDDMRWLGIDWDKGAGLDYLGKTKDPHESDYIQSQSLERYEKVFLELLKQDRLYPCSCSRKDIQMAQHAPHLENELCYPNTCRHRWQNEAEAAQHKGQDPCWRFICSDTLSSFDDHFYGLQSSQVKTWSGDFIIAQTRKRYGYQLAVVVDDHFHGITQVIRGDDLLHSTHRQLQLYQALSYQPPAFTHLPLVVGPDGKRLAKRHGDLKICTLREQGNSPEKILGFLAFSFNWLDFGETCSLSEMLDLFKPESLPRESLVIGPKELNFLNLS